MIYLKGTKLHRDRRVIAAVHSLFDTVEVRLYVRFVTPTHCAMHRVVGLHKIPSPPIHIRTLHVQALFESLYILFIVNLRV